MAASGQTINDRLNAVRYALVGQGLARTVCKATTLEVSGPKKKHIDYLIACTNEPNVSTPQLANLLIERTQHTNWAAVFKSLISIHHLMSYGNERFTQYLATSNHSFELADFMDRTTPQGYNMSTFVRRYAKYINDKSVSYRTLAIDLCKIRSGNDNALRTMNMDNLSKTLPIVQAQFDSLLEFGAEPKDLNNGVIMAAFRLLYKDLVKLYVAYQEAIINLLERYFKLSRKKTREALGLYKNYLARMNKVAGFLRVVDAVELDKSEMPDLTNSPASILKLLEQHLAQLEAKKHGGAAPATPEDQSTAQGETSEDGAETTTSKENEPPASKADEKQVPSGHQNQPPMVVEGEPPKPKPPVSNEPEKPAPPQKPARPSPKASPKVSPAASKKPASVETNLASPCPSPAPPPPPPAPAAVAPEKKGPPERPAKPPSRPPPPSAVSGGAAAAPVASSSPSSTPTAQSDPPTSAQAKVASPTPQPPPPPPPPPQPPQPPQPPAVTLAPEAELTPEQAGDEQQGETTPETAGQASNANSNGQLEPDEAPAPTTSCSATVNSETIESDATASEANTHETNHVNNGTSQIVAPEEDMVHPPPPPPLPPIDDNEFENIQQQEPGVLDANAGAPQEPIENGENGHTAE